VTTAPAPALTASIDRFARVTMPPLPKLVLSPSLLATTQQASDAVQRHRMLLRDLGVPPSMSQLISAQRAGVRAVTSDAVRRAVEIGGPWSALGRVDASEIPNEGGQVAVDTRRSVAARAWIGTTQWVAAVGSNPELQRTLLIEGAAMIVHEFFPDAPESAIRIFAAMVILGIWLG